MEWKPDTKFIDQRSYCVQIQIFACVLAFVARTPRLMIVQNVINIFLFVGVSSEAKKVQDGTRISTDD